MSQKNSPVLQPLYVRLAEGLRHNQEQWQAYNSKNHCVVLAGPGSGKTKTLVLKVARLLTEEIRAPRGVACVTFNNECAREIQRRLEETGVYANERLFVGTVHSFCFKQIIMPFAKLAGVNISRPIAIAKSTERRDCLGEAMQKVKRPGNPEGLISDFEGKRKFYLGPQYQYRNLDKEWLALCENYELALRRRGLIDFDDMVILGLRMIEEHAWLRDLLRARFPVLVVDEYQDLGLTLHKIVDQLCFNTGVRLFAVGDPDQSIYSFMGARPILLQNLSKRPEIEPIRLQLNYRCGKRIVKASEITLNEHRGYITPQDSSEGVIYFQEVQGGIQEQAEMICTRLVPEILQRRKGRNPSDIAVLYLNKTHGNYIADAAEKAGIAFTRIDGNAPYPKTPLTRWLEQCALWCAGGWERRNPKLSTITSIWTNWHRVASTDSQRTSIQRALATFLWSNRDPEMSLLLWLKNLYGVCLQQFLAENKEFRDEEEAFTKLAKSCQATGKFQKARLVDFAGQNGTPDHLNLITLHSAKGLEFEVVIMMGMDQGNIPHTRADENGKKESRRLFYVGITRAKQEVHLVHRPEVITQGGTRIAGPSEFLVQLQSQLDDLVYEKS